MGSDFFKTNPAKDYTNGMYWHSRCWNCASPFSGPKRARVCKECHVQEARDKLTEFLQAWVRGRAKRPVYVQHLNCTVGVKTTNLDYFVKTAGRLSENLLEAQDA